MMLTDKTALITGATAGIGLALAKQLVACGCTVIAVGRSQERLEAISLSLDGVIPIRCDIASKAEILDLSKRVHALGQPLSILVNNAAVQYTPKFTDEDFSFEGIEREIDTNFTSIAWLTAQFLPMLMASGHEAAIVNMSSGLAIYPKTSSAVYCATKAAVHSLSQSLRYQLEGTEVRVTEVLLPLVETAMTEGRGSGKITPDEAADAVVQALIHNIEEKYVGKAALLPALSYALPPLARRLLKNA